jgi:hypothetical protein
MAMFANPRTVLATDRAIVVLQVSKLTWTPEEILARLPRSTQIGPVSGWWSKTELNGDTAVDTSPIPW